MIGDLKQRLVIEEAITVTDEGGGQSVTWQSLALKPAVWAAVTPLTAAKEPTALQNEHQATHRITLRRRDDLLPTMRFRHGARLFMIEAILDQDQNRRFLDVLTREITP